MTDDNIIRRAYPPPAKTGKQQGNRGCFQPGQSGNPKGRPQGSRHRATLAALALMAGDLEVITGKLVEKAKEGEQWAIRMVLDKLIPNAKYIPVPLRLPRMEGIGDIKIALGVILKAVGKGMLAPDEAKSLSEVINTLGLAQQVEELEKRLEQMQGGKI